MEAAVNNLEEAPKLMPGNVRYGGQNPPHPTPTRAMSLDSLHDKNANLDSKAHEYIPSRITRTTPKINEAAMQFVKTGPAVLYKSATEQIKKAEAVKAMRQHLIAEEADWQEVGISMWSSLFTNQGLLQGVPLGLPHGFFPLVVSVGAFMTCLMVESSQGILWNIFSKHNNSFSSVSKKS
ncbi:hypothetical protein Hamer_G017016 [Homarus americanus]|uniref:Uncharacterized protein n=1 Tax=Homarus americanus TaxID=6706 RepID=A0A8J5NAR8_HOMAM|nr:hypothetical protein Hamer_G017016 [Homarus americanus]